MNFISVLCFQILAVIFILVSIVINLVKVVKGKISKKYLILILVVVVCSEITLINIIIPKIKDIKYYKKEEYYITTGTCNSFSNYRGITQLEVNNIIYKIDSWKIKPQIGTKYRLEYLPNSKFVIKASELKNNNSIN